MWLRWRTKDSPTGQRSKTGDGKATWDQGEELPTGRTQARNEGTITLATVRDQWDDRITATTLQVQTGDQTNGKIFHWDAADFMKTDHTTFLKTSHLTRAFCSRLGPNCTGDSGQQHDVDVVPNCERVSAPAPLWAADWTMNLMNLNVKHWYLQRRWSCNCSVFFTSVYLCSSCFLSSLFSRLSSFHVDLLPSFKPILMFFLNQAVAVCRR